MFFAADDGVIGNEVYVSDGTPGGTHLLQDIRPGPAHSSVHQFVSFKGLVWIASAVGGVWKSDGTTAGTVKYSSMSPGEMEAVGDSLYFVASGSFKGTELWATDGSSSGAYLVKDIAPGSSHARPKFLTPAGNLLFFAATESTHGEELWRTDGTESGTILLGDIAPNSDSAGLGNFCAVGSKLYFISRRTTSPTVTRSGFRMALPPGP
jgi:ELWxxDGT repeat protein